MNPIKSADISRMRSPLLSGLLYAFSATLTIAFLISLLLYMTDFNEDSLSTWILLTHGASSALGGFICGRRASRKGWYNGGILGVFYGLLVIIIGYFGFNAALSFPMLSLLATGMLSGSIGGMLGVNTSR